MTVITHSTQRASISIARVYFISCVCLSLCLQNGALIPPAHSALPPPADPCTLAFFLALNGKFPWVGTFELSNPLRWRRKMRANAPSSVTLYSGIVPFKHFNVRFFVSINVFHNNSARILIKTARHDDTSLWFGVSLQSCTKVRETFRQIWLRNCGPERPETWTNCLFISLL